MVFPLSYVVLAVAAKGVFKIKGHALVMIYY
ncbi:hypothetical protein X965_08510 [Morganella sp. EGD-HP17]|nr:hypothetical protein X965_08510 [Morganella sp. EGD-HP17]